MAGFSSSALASFQDVRRAFDSGQYFSAARLAFNDANHSTSNADKALAYYWVTESLVRAGLDQSATYFFIRTIQLQDRNASRKVLELAPLFIERTGADFMRKFLLKYTHPDDYSQKAKNAFLLAISKDKLLKGDYAGTIQAASQVDRTHPLFPVALQMKATAETMLNQTGEALRDFEMCADTADQRTRIETGSVEASLATDQPSVLLSKWNNLKRLF